jgi:hypothetical protein
MAGDDALDVYLNDHLSGATAGVELADRIRSANEGTPLAAVLEGLRADIEADRATLVSVMEALDVARSTPKQLAGKVMETMSRLRLSARVTGSPDVSRLMELEALSLGIEGKASLWGSLATLEATRPALAGFDLAGLTRRAADQRAAVEPHRLEAAVAAFASAGG